jgi:hypothetical protein
MTNQLTLAEFLGSLDGEMLAQVTELCEIIVDADPTLVETMKWGAPSFVHNGIDRLTLNLLNKDGCLKLVLHMGASTPEDRSAAPIMDDDTGLVKWSSNIRGIITFPDLEYIHEHRQDITKVVTNWLAIG